MSTMTAPQIPFNGDDNHSVAPGFKERFRHARRRVAKRLIDLAAETGIPKGTLEAWSSGKRSPSLGPPLTHLAEALDCDLGWLTTGEGDVERKHRRSNHPKR
jgi:transcriptional regulator with XRE-family HTH domain